MGKLWPIGALILREMVRVGQSDDWETWHYNAIQSYVSDDVRRLIRTAGMDKFVEMRKFFDWMIQQWGKPTDGDDAKLKIDKWTMAQAENIDTVNVPS